MLLLRRVPDCLSLRLGELTDYCDGTKRAVSELNLIMKDEEDARRV